MQNRISFNLDHHLTLTNSQNSQTLSRTLTTVIYSRIFSFGLNNFCINGQQRFLLDVF